MNQWLEQPLVWTKYTDSKADIQEWIKGTDYPKDQIRSTIYNTIMMERDCERRSLELLKSFGYKKANDYMRKANAYTLFYFFVEDERTWNKKGKSPYTLPIWKEFPASFDIDIKETYKRLKHLYYQCI